MPWRHDIKRKDPICAVLPKVAKASTMVTVARCCRRHYHSKLCQCKRGLMEEHKLDGYGLFLPFMGNTSDSSTAMTTDSMCSKTFWATKVIKLFTAVIYKLGSATERISASLANASFAMFYLWPWEEKKLTLIWQTQNILFYVLGGEMFLQNVRFKIFHHAM